MGTKGSIISLKNKKQKQNADPLDTETKQHT